MDLFVIDVGSVNLGTTYTKASSTLGKEGTKLLRISLTSVFPKFRLCFTKLAASEDLHQLQRHDSYVVSGDEPNGWVQ